MGGVRTLGTNYFPEQRGGGCIHVDKASWKWAKHPIALFGCPGEEVRR